MEQTINNNQEELIIIQAEGQQGFHGKNGKNYNQLPENYYLVYDKGQNGQNGDKGQDGQNIEISIKSTKDSIQIISKNNDSLNKMLPHGKSFKMELISKGGIGGNGGNGGNGYKGHNGKPVKCQQHSKYGENCFYDQDAGDGGEGGDAGSGGMGGKGGDVIITLSQGEMDYLPCCQKQPHLLEGGHGGKQGIPGQGGEGGSSRFHLCIYSKQPKIFGKKGKVGKEGIEGAKNIQGKYYYKINELEGLFEDIYDLKIFNSQLQQKTDNFYEPGEFLQFDWIKLTNRNHMPTPSQSQIKISVANSNYIIFKEEDQIFYNQQILKDQVKQIDSPLKFQIKNFKFEENLKKLDVEINLIAKISRSELILDKLYKRNITVSYPVEIFKITHSQSIFLDQESPFMACIKNISSKDLDHTRKLKIQIQFLNGEKNIAFLADQNLANDFQQITQTQIFNNNQIIYTKEIESLSKKQSFFFGGVFKFLHNQNVQPFSVSNFEVQLLIAPISNPEDDPVIIQHQKFSIQLSQSFNHKENSNFLLVVNNKINQHIIKQWEDIAFSIGSSIDIWNSSNYKDFSLMNLDQKTGKFFYELYSDKLVVIYNNEYENDSNDTIRNLDYIKKNEIFLIAKMYNVSTFIIGGDFDFKAFSTPYFIKNKDENVVLSNPEFLNADILVQQQQELQQQWQQYKFNQMLITSDLLLTQTGVETLQQQEEENKQQMNPLEQQIQSFFNPQNPQKQNFNYEQNHQQEEEKEQQNNQQQFENKYEYPNFIPDQFDQQFDQQPDQWFKEGQIQPKYDYPAISKADNQKTQQSQLDLIGQLYQNPTAQIQIQNAIITKNHINKYSQPTLQDFQNYTIQTHQLFQSKFPFKQYFTFYKFKPEIVEKGLIRNTWNMGTIEIREGLSRAKHNLAHRTDQSIETTFCDQFVCLKLLPFKAKLVALEKVSNNDIQLQMIIETLFSDLFDEINVIKNSCSELKEFQIVNQMECWQLFIQGNYDGIIQNKDKKIDFLKIFCKHLYELELYIKNSLISYIDKLKSLILKDNSSLIQKITSIHIHSVIEKYFNYGIDPQLKIIWQDVQQQTENINFRKFDQRYGQNLIVMNNNHPSNFQQNIMVADIAETIQKTINQQQNQQQAKQFIINHYVNSDSYNNRQKILQKLQELIRKEEKKQQ